MNAYDEVIFNFIKENEGCDTIGCARAFSSPQSIDHIYDAVDRLIKSGHVVKVPSKEMHFLRIAQAPRG